MGKTQRKLRKNERRKSAMAKQAKKEVTFHPTSKEYNGYNKDVFDFMVGVKNFLSKKDMTREQKNAFLDEYELSPEIFRVYSLFVRSFEKCMDDWDNEIKKEGKKLLSVEKFCIGVFKQIDKRIREKIRFPHLFPNGNQFGNERVPVSKRRLVEAQKILNEMKSRLSSSSSSATPSA